jgi:DNA-directed RNA polymerase specialized sigma24 family protein
MTQQHVTQWLDQLKKGDQAAAQRLLDLYFQRLVKLAGSRLRARPAWASYDEDVALSAFKSLCAGAEQGRFPRLSNRDDLWRLLALLTIRKAIDMTRRRWPEQHAAPEDMSGFLSREPTPEMAAEVADEMERLLGRLDDPELCQIALKKVEGFTNAEIANQIGCVVRTVERKLHRIRLLWEQELVG